MELFQYLLGWLYIMLIKVISLLPDNEMVDFKRGSQCQQCSQMLLLFGTIFSCGLIPNSEAHWCVFNSFWKSVAHVGSFCFLKITWTQKRVGLILKVNKQGWKEGFVVLWPDYLLFLVSLIKDNRLGSMSGHGEAPFATGPTQSHTKSFSKYTHSVSPV